MTEERNLTVQSTHLMPAMNLATATDRYRALVHFTSELMREGADYGKVPGSDKPTLLKPGAEKLTTFFGLTVRFEVVESVQDWTGAAHGGEPFFYYWFRCRQYRGDLLVAEADGSCNSWESKYRYRTAERVCPTCGQAAIIKAQEKYGGGWVCWAKRSGCGAKFKAGDAAIEGQIVGKVPNANPADIANTVLKIAQKRSLVATTLLAVNASEFFTQDMEDLADVIDVTPTPAPAPAAPRAEEPKAATTEATAAPTPAPANGHANGKTRMATVKTQRWGMAAQEFARHEPHYQKADGTADFYHMLCGALQIGFTAVTDANLVDILDALRAHAQEAASRAEDAPATTEGADIPADALGG